MKIVTTCPNTFAPLYISDIKPKLIHMGAKGDWGYHPKASMAVDMTPQQAMLCMKDMEATGRKPAFTA